MTFVALTSTWLLALTAALALVARREALVSAWRTLRLTTSSSEDLRSGSPQAIRGEVSARSVVRDPVLGIDVAFFCLELRRVGVPEPLLSLTSGGPLVVVDEGGPSEVYTDGAEVVVANSYSRSAESPSALMKALLANAGATLPEPEVAARYELCHGAIRVGESRTVIGVAQAGPRFDASTGRLWIGEETLPALQTRERQSLRRAKWMIAAAATLIVLGLVTPFVMLTLS